jgi:Spy/CpxP family protein refolding chaperone
MKKITLALMGMALISTLLLTSGVLAGRGGAGMGRHGMGGCGMEMRMGMGPGTCWALSFPDLTAEQSAKLTDLQKRFIEGTSKIRSDVAVKRIELNQLLNQPQPNTEEVMAMQKELLNLQSQLQQKCLSSQLEIRKIVPEEQLSQFSNRLGSGSYASPEGMREYGPPRGRGFGPCREGTWDNRGGGRQGW